MIMYSYETDDLCKNVPVVYHKQLHVMDVSHSSCICKFDSTNQNCPVA